MGRNSKEFNRINQFTASDRLMKKLDEDKLYEVFLTLENRIKTGRNWDRKQQNWGRLKRFAQYLISKTHLLTLYKKDEKLNWKEIDRLEAKVKHLEEENIELRRKARTTSHEEARHKIRTHVQMLEKEMKRGDRLETQVRNLTAIINGKDKSTESTQTVRSFSSGREGDSEANETDSEIEDEKENDDKAPYQISSEPPDEREVQSGTVQENEANSTNDSNESWGEVHQITEVQGKR
jgi:hypothetical protein